MSENHTYTLKREYISQPINFKEKEVLINPSIIIKRNPDLMVNFGPKNPKSVTLSNIVEKSSIKILNLKNNEKVEKIEEKLTGEKIIPSMVCYRVDKKSFEDIILKKAKKLLYFLNIFLYKINETKNNYK